MEFFYCAQQTDCTDPFAAFSSALFRLTHYDTIIHASLASHTHARTHTTLHAKRRQRLGETVLYLTLDVLNITLIKKI